MKFSLNLFIFCLGSLCFVSCADKADYSEYRTVVLNFKKTRDHKINRVLDGKSLKTAKLGETKTENAFLSSWGLSSLASNAEVDCVGVFIRYPELPSLGYCEDSSSNQLFEYDIMEGSRSVDPTTTSTASIQINGVKTGSARKFYLAGFKAAGACPNFYNFDATPKSTLSPPRVISTAIVDIPATSTEGEVINVNMSVNVSNGYDFDSCEGGGDLDSSASLDLCSGLSVPCFARYDFSNSSYLYSDITCTSPVSGVANDDVLCAKDNEGGAYDATSANAATGPRLLTNANGLNSLHALSFAQTTYGGSGNEYLEFPISPSTLASASGMSIVIVIEPDVTSTAANYFFGSMIGSVGTPSGQFGLIYGGTNQLNLAAYGVVGATPTWGGPTPKIVVINFDGVNNHEIFIDGTSGGAFTSSGTLPTVNWKLGGLSASDGTFAYTKSKIGEIIFYGAELSANDVQIVNSVLSSKWR